MRKMRIEGLQEDKMYTADEVRQFVKREVIAERTKWRELCDYNIYEKMIEADFSVDAIATAFEGRRYLDDREQIEEDKTEYWAKKIKETPHLAHYLDEQPDSVFSLSQNRYSKSLVAVSSDKACLLAICISSFVACWCQLFLGFSFSLKQSNSR